MKVFTKLAIFVAHASILQCYATVAIGYWRFDRSVLERLQAVARTKGFDARRTEMALHSGTQEFYAFQTLQRDYIITTPYQFEHALDDVLWRLRQNTAPRVIKTANGLRSAPPRQNEVQQPTPTHLTPSQRSKV